MSIKNFLMSDTRLRRGIFMGIAAALLMTLLLVFLGGLIELFFEASGKASDIGFLIGLGIGPLLGTAVYRYGRIDIPKNYRAIGSWFGERVEGLKYEIPEGDRWIFKFFGAVGKNMHTVNMKERSEKLVDIPVEVENGNKVPTTITIQWKPTMGSLVAFDNLENPVAAFTSEAEQVVRTFGIAHTDLDDLIHDGFAEQLAPIVLEALQFRSRGEIVELDITVDTANKTVTHEFKKVPGVVDAEPWGISFLSVSVNDFTLPQEISDAADELDATERSVKTSKTLTDGIVANMKPLTGEGVNATAAMAQVAAAMMPEGREQPVKTLNVTGLEGVAQIIANTLLAAMGKPPLPTDPEPPTETQEEKDKPHVGE